MKMINVIKRKAQVDGMCENCRHHATHNPPKKEYNYIKVNDGWKSFSRYVKDISEIENYENLPQHLFCSDCSKLVETTEEEYIEPLF